MIKWVCYFFRFGDFFGSIDHGKRFVVKDAHIIQKTKADGFLQIGFIKYFRLFLEKNINPTQFIDPTGSGSLSKSVTAMRRFFTSKCDGYRKRKGCKRYYYKLYPSMI